MSDDAKADTVAVWSSAARTDTALADEAAEAARADEALAEDARLEKGDEAERAAAETQMVWDAWVGEMAREQIRLEEFERKSR